MSHELIELSDAELVSVSGGFAWARAGAAADSNAGGPHFAATRTFTATNTLAVSAPGASVASSGSRSGSAAVAY
ncbi:conserved protein of unknown function [Rhodovastum atsumiense]|nr:conserved protein of unknown function [Rhodovastum atsumiense]